MGLVPWALWGVSGVRCQVSRSSAAKRSGSGEDLEMSSKRQVFHLIAVVLFAVALVWTQSGLALWATALLVAWALWPGAPDRSRLPAAGAVLAGAAIGIGLLFAASRWRGDWRGPTGRHCGACGLSLSALFAGLELWHQHARLEGRSSVAARSGRAGTGDGHGHPGPRCPPRTRGTIARLDPGQAVQSALGFSLVVGLILILLTTTLARPLWRALPTLAGTLTYPWQLFALVGPLLAILAGAVLVVERRLALLPMWAGLVVFVVLSSTAYLSPRFTQVDPSTAPAAIFGSNQVTLLTAGATFLNEQTPSAASPYTLQPAVLPPATLQPADLQPATLPPATPLTVTVAWQALQPIDFDYNLFVHAVDEAGNKLAQWDGQPQRGQESPIR